VKAYVVAMPGGPEQLERTSLPRPVPGPGEVLVQVAFAGINFMDVHTRQGKYEHSRTYPVRLPTTLGMEGSGVVCEVGRGVQDFRVGDRVAWCIHWGSYADFAVVPAGRLARVPDEVGLDVAAAAMFQGCTAHYLINDVGRVITGTSCLVLAASGGIGQLLVQMAKSRGATVLAVTSSGAKAELARRRGADAVMPYEGFADHARKLTDGRGVDVVYDAVGAPSLRESFRATRTRGLVVNYGSVGGSLKDLDPIELGEGGSLYLTRPRLADHMNSPEVIRTRARDVFDAIVEGSLIGKAVLEVDSTLR
jgi:NADPH:quinone reductase